MACLEDEDKKNIVRRFTLDFFCTHFKLTRDLFSKNEKSILVHVIYFLLLLRFN